MTTVVVGGGISGLVAARTLFKKGEDVRLLEASDRVGGVIQTVRTDGGYLLELGPNTVRPTPELMDLIREIRLEGEVLLSDPHAPRYLSWKGKLQAMPSSPGSLFSTPLLSAGGKARLFAEPFVPRRRNGAEESVREFFARRVGAEIAERFVAPFISGIFAGDPDRLSAEAAFPSLVRGEREFGSLVAWGIRGRSSAPKPKGPKVRGLLSFRKGLGALPAALAAELGGRIATNCPVHAIAPAARGGGSSGWKLDTALGTVEADRVVLACPSHVASRLVFQLAPFASASLSEIPEPSVAVLHFSFPKAALPRPLHGFGHLVIREPGQRVLGAVWSSSLFAGRAPDGFELLTAFVGGRMDPEAARLPDEAIAAQAGRELRSLLEASQNPTLVRLTRWEAAIPQYERGHGARMETLSIAESRYKGLAFLGAYRGGVSVGDVVKSALAVA